MSENKKTRPSVVKQAVKLTKLAAEARHAGNEKEALDYEAQVQQLEWRAVSKTKVPYDVFIKHAHYEKFETSKELWNQASRGAHADTGGKNTTARRAEKVEALLVAGQAAGRSATAIAFEISSFVTKQEAAHYLAVRNSIAELGNEAQLRELLKETEGNMEKAKALAKARRISWAPVYATPEDEARADQAGVEFDEEPTSATANVDDEPKVDEPNMTGARDENGVSIANERAGTTEGAEDSEPDGADATNDTPSSAFENDSTDTRDEGAVLDAYVTDRVAHVDATVIITAAADEIETRTEAS